MIGMSPSTGVHLVAGPIRNYLLLGDIVVFLLIAGTGCEHNGKAHAIAYSYEVQQTLNAGEDGFMPATMLRVSRNGEYEYTVYLGLPTGTTPPKVFRGRLPDRVLHPFLTWASRLKEADPVVSRGDLQHFEFSIDRPTMQPNVVIDINEYLKSEYNLFE